MKFLYYSAFVSAFLGLAFVTNNFLTYIFDLPGLFGTLAFLGFGYFDITGQDYSGVFLFFGTHNVLQEAMMKIPEKPTEIIAMPLSRSFGLARMRCVFSNGGTIVLSKGLLNPAFLETLNFGFLLVC